MMERYVIIIEKDIYAEDKKEAIRLALLDISEDDIVDVIKGEKV